MFWTMQQQLNIDDLPIYGVHQEVLKTLTAGNYIDLNVVNGKGNQAVSQAQGSQAVYKENIVSNSNIYEQQVDKVL